MKTIASILSLIVCMFLFSSVSNSQSIVSFGKIDSDKLLSQLPEYEESKTALMLYGSQLEDQISRMHTEFEKKYKYYIDNSKSMSDAIKQAREQELQELQLRIRTFQETAQQNLNIKEQELLNSIIEKTKKSIEAIGKYNNLDIVFDESAGSFLYSSNVIVDIFDVVNQNFKYRNNLSVTKPTNYYSFGILDSDKFLAQLPDRETAKQNLQNYSNQLQNTLSAMQDEFNEKYNYYTENYNHLSETVREAKENELQNLQSRVQTFQQTAQQDLQAKEHELFLPIIEKTNKSIEAISKYNNLDLVFDKSVGLILYSSENISDIFSATLQNYTEQSNAGIIKSNKSCSYALVNSAQLFEQLSDTKKAKQEIENFTKQSENEMTRLGNEFQLKVNYYNDNSENMSDAIKQGKEQELQELQSQLATYQEQASLDIKKKEKELMQPIINRIEIAIKEISKEMQYDLTFDASSAAILFFNPKYDITDIVLNQLIGKTTIISLKNSKDQTQSVSSRVKMYVEERVNQWQQKGEFEKTDQYKSRVNEASRAKKIEEFQIEAINRIKKQLADSINLNSIKLGSYDADNECFLLSSQQLGEFVIAVPLSEAPAFKSNYSTMTIQNTDFIIKEDNLVLSHIEIVNANNKTYSYDIKNNATYSLAKIDYNFSDFQVDVEDKTIVSNNQIQKSTNTISVGKSDVDVDIPKNPVTKTNTYALIIGNEDYSSFQTGLNTEINVDFAMNDAKVFKEYCNKTLGIPEKQIKLLINATSGQMRQGIAWLNNLAKIDEGKAELIFYYSGHGLPEEQSKEAYIMPVDVSGNNISYAIKLADVYSSLNEHPSKKITVFLDACFSGGARNQGLIAMKGVKVRPKENLLNGNMVVFSSSTGEESSGVYKDKQHGYMTYFLLKKVQISKGVISYKELAEYIIENVKKETALTGKTQTPQLNFSPSVENTWKNWSIK